MAWTEGESVGEVSLVTKAVEDKRSHRSLKGKDLLDGEMADSQRITEAREKYAGVKKPCGVTRA